MFRAYGAAVEAIKEARRTGSVQLDLSNWGSPTDKLTVVPPVLEGFTNLRSLDLSSNSLSRLPSFLGEFRCLEELSIGHNQLNVIPDWLGQLTSLKRLTLARNKVTELPLSLQELTDLRSLELAYNPIANVPVWIGQFRQLENLDLTGLKLGHIPEWLPRLDKLRELGLGFNMLEVLPPQFAALKSLEHLDLWGNKFSVLPEALRSLSQVAVLYLHDCSLVEIPRWISELGALQFIGLGANRLNTLPSSFGELQELRSLFLGFQAGAGNPLREVPHVISRLRKLERLFLVQCELTTLPEWFGELKLKTLDLSRNALADLPPTLANIAELESLDLDANPLNPDLAAAYSEGIEDVKRYLREMAKGARDRYEAKLLILGDGNEGKTCVSRALRGLPFRTQQTTRGVDVVQWKFSHPDDQENSEKDITLNIWDFEGQEISHQTHQFFLTSKSLYLLVFKCRDQFLMDRMEYWMDTIRARAPQARIAIVISQCEERSPHIPLDKIEGQYGDMLAPQWFFDVGCENGRNIKTLQTFLQRSAADLEFMGSPWPRSYDRAEQQLKKKAKTRSAYISRAKLESIFASAGIEADNYEGAAGAMSRLGVITQFPDCPDLRDFVVLKPQWLTKGISRVMEDGKLADDKGEITLRRMEAIWSKARYPGMFATFHDCMKEFELCYDLEDQSKSCLVPLRFGYIAPTIPWSLGGDVKERRLQYKLQIRPPMGFMSRFIVKTHHMIAKSLEYPKGVYWHNGVFLRSPGLFPSEALCEFVADDRVFHVKVRAAFPQNMCEQIHGYLQAVFSFFGGLAAERAYGCIHVDSQSGAERPCSGLHTERRIYTAIAKARETFDCEFEEHEVDPRLLVGGFTSFSDFVVERVTAAMRQEMDKPPAWALPFLSRFSSLLNWVKNNSSKLDEVLRGQRTLVSEFKQETELKLHEYLNCISALLDDRDHTAAPGLISIMTNDRSAWNPVRFFRKTYVLTPFCECEGNIHACEDGKVKFTKDQEWWAKSAPWVARGTKILTAGLQLAFAGMPLALGTNAAKDVENEIKFMNELTKHLELKIRADNVPGTDAVVARDEGKELRGTDTEAALTRAALSIFLEEAAPERYRARRWGSLRRKRMSDNSYRWLCAEHAG